MKTFDEMNEHHDISGEAWPEEILSMSVDELLDRLEQIDRPAYEEIEDIIKRRMQAIMGNEIAPVEDELPTFDEIKDVEDRLRGDISPETRAALMRKRKELGGEDLDNFEF